MLPKALRSVIAAVCFAAGCLAAGLTVVWYAGVLIARVPIWPFPGEIAKIEALFGIWALVMFATFLRSAKPIWNPLFEATSARVKTARFLLVCALIHCGLWLLVCLVLILLQARESIPWIFCLQACSLILLNAAYVTIHWAFRPENLFSERFRLFADDPIIFAIFHWRTKRRAK